MRRLNTEAAREARLWVRQVIFPAIIGTTIAFKSGAINTVVEKIKSYNNSKK